MEEILSCAARLFFEKGFHATTIEDVAREVGILKGSLYYYINSKDDLLYELLMADILRGDAYIGEKIAGITDPVEKLRRALEGHIEFIIQNRVRVGLFLHEFDTLGGRRNLRVLEAMQRYQHRFVSIIKEGQAAGKFKDLDPTLVANALLGMGNWIYRWYREDRKPAPDQILQTFLQIMMHGILKS
jgi:AcrR family transcriptional regulator